MFNPLKYKIKSHGKKIILFVNYFNPVKSLNTVLEIYKNPLLLNVSRSDLDLMELNKMPPKDILRRFQKEVFNSFRIYINQNIDKIPESIKGVNVHIVSGETYNMAFDTNLQVNRGILVFYVCLNTMITKFLLKNSFLNLIEHEFAHAVDPFIKEVNRRVYYKTIGEGTISRMLFYVVGSLRTEAYAIIKPGSEKRGVNVRDLLYFQGYIEKLSRDDIDDTEYPNINKFYASGLIHSVAEFMANIILLAELRKKNSGANVHIITDKITGIFSVSGPLNGFFEDASFIRIETFMESRDVVLEVSDKIKCMNHMDYLKAYENARHVLRISDKFKIITYKEYTLLRKKAREFQKERLIKR